MPLPTDLCLTFIIGAGPAGGSAALWCDELGLDTLVLEQSPEIGGQLLSVYNRIENYLGARARDGHELRDLFAEQVKDAEFDLWTDVEIESVDLKSKRLALRSGEELQAISIIIATGVRRRRLACGRNGIDGRGVMNRQRATATRWPEKMCAWWAARCCCRERSLVGGSLPYRDACSSRKKLRARASL